MPDDRQRFQGKCLVSTEGWRWMSDAFDYFPPKVRARLASSDYNLCAACVRDAGGNISDIERLEARIRAEECAQRGDS